MKLDKIFRTAVEYHASDIYITTGTKPIIRIHGDLMPIEEHSVLTKEMAEDYLLDTMNDQQRETFRAKQDLDFSVEIPGVARLRANLFIQRKGIGGIFRLIPSNVYSMDDLGLPDCLRKIPHYPNGIVLVTGPTGSGKSTTLAAILNEINSNYAEHIITIEDPIEFVHENRKSIIEQREVGTHTKTFQKALRASLREDTDVILIGEMRDLETMGLAITAAETGHLVLATLHTSGAAKAIDRVIDAFPPEQQNQIRIQLSETLRTIVWQTLLKRKDGKGRVAAFEILFNNHAIANLIRKSKTYQIPSVLETSQQEGMQTMEKAILNLLQGGYVNEDEAKENLPEKIEI